ncbi:exonuclease domain-containing protein [Phycicoccus sonneratiae]|uniref:Lsr2 family protein n=1 Tax=Phycicoccus sonneratiae TaxID=2807628 RepID=A0ABS2CRW6_9MICO|nr:histone-like nucleoid-structuring protein Lsr2 [Phycicoccus sonneraticus]MBM6402620.1 Lsr2 family protein [Phycicoccus sonneraticus]
MGLLDKFLGRPSQRAPFQQTMPTPPAPPGQPHFVVIDVETTGLSPEEDRIVEIALVTTDAWGRVLEEWGTRVNPEGPVGGTHIHGITQADVANAPVFADVVAQLNQRLAGAALVAHNAKFDIAFVRAEYRRAGWDMPDIPVLCTLEACDYYLSALDRRRLADCCWAVGTPLTGAHSALGDARATAVLLAAFMHPHVGYPPRAEHLAMPQEALKIPWPASPTLPLGPGLRATSALSSARSTEPPAVRVPALVELVARFSLIDALDEGAPPGAVAYLERLAEALEDGEITTEEAAGLAAVAEAQQLDHDAIDAANRAFVLALAYAATEDGKVTRAERAELLSISELLGVSYRVIPALLERAELARNRRMSLGLAELPDNWSYGEPLRVGDKVVFTGCDSTVRTRLETESEQLGVRVVGGVSAKTAMLVSDGTMNGTKAAKAREIHCRVEHPDTYAILLRHLQPALPREARALPASQIHPKHASREDATAVAVPSSGAGPNPAVVRAWARANGYEVGTRGRLHKDLIDAYLQANSAS